MKKLNQPSSFRYAHIDRTCVPRDVRRKAGQEIVREHCYFIGFRISAESGVHYQQALILADDHESLIDGIKEECNKILDQRLATSLNDIEPMFVRNMMMRDPAMIASINACGINTEIQEILSRRDDNQFTVFGMLGNEQICLIPEKAHDALTAMRLARWQSVKLAGKNFTPLDVRQAHPVTCSSRDFI